MVKIELKADFNKGSLELSSFRDWLQTSLLRPNIISKPVFTTYLDLEPTGYGIL